MRWRKDIKAIDRFCFWLYGKQIKLKIKQINNITDKTNVILAKYSDTIRAKSNIQTSTIDIRELVE